MATETNHAQENAQAWLENIISMVKRLGHVQECKPYLDYDTDSHEVIDGCVALDDVAAYFGNRGGMPSLEDCERYHDADAALEAIMESPLSVEVRSDWVNPGSYLDAPSCWAEYKILLTTGGPALRIIGELDQYGEPESARLEYQDWGTPWTEYSVFRDSGIESFTEREAMQGALLTFARQFYYGS